MNIHERIAHETRKHKVRFWSSEYEIEPVLAETILGDGLQLIFLENINQRPDYWLIRIDSKTNINDDDFDIETIIDLLEEEFRRHPGCLVSDQDFYKYKTEKKEGYSCLDDYETFEEYDLACKYPALWWEGGHWGSIANYNNLLFKP